MSSEKKIAEIKAKIKGHEKRIERMSLEYYDNKFEAELYNRLLIQIKEKIAELEEELSSKKELQEVSAGSNYWKI